MDVDSGVASHDPRSGSVYLHGRDNVDGVLFWSTSLTSLQEDLGF